MEMNKAYGAMPPKKDIRDYKIKSCSTVDVNDMELQHLPKIKNQGTVSSCVAHASSSVLEWFNEEEVGEYRELSTDFIYGMQGVKLGRMEEGMYLRDACKIIKEYGDALNSTISTNTEMPRCAKNLSKLLTDDVLKEAEICKVESYAKCETDNDIKYALMNYGGILAAIKWYNKYSFKDEVIEFDTTSKKVNHAVMIYGFCENGWKCINSWGAFWGNKGKFILPYEHGIMEAWSFVDAENSDVYKPKRNAILDVIYKIINFVLNLFSKRGNRL